MYHEGTQIHDTASNTSEQFLFSMAVDFDVPDCFTVTAYDIFGGESAHTGPVCKTHQRGAPDMPGNVRIK